MNAEIKDIKRYLDEAENAVVLTGAGISTESGVPDFRGANGLWRNHDVFQVASIETFEKNAKLAWQFYAERFGALEDIKPNAGHYAIAELEKRGLIRGVITQNIDGLHRKAGSQLVLEVHGTITTASCRTCKASASMYDCLSSSWSEQDGYPHCTYCSPGQIDSSQIMKPDVILFGEDLPPAANVAMEWVDEADLIICCGSSLQVTPVGLFPWWIKRDGGRVVIINQGVTDADSIADIKIDAGLGETLSYLTQ